MVQIVFYQTIYLKKSYIFVNFNFFVAYDTIEFNRIKFTNENISKASSIIVLHTRNVTPEKLIHKIEKIDRCCKSDGDLLDSSQLEFDSSDTIKRISCNISKEEFTKKYISKRNPVILNRCQKTWKAKDWTFSGTPYKVVLN